MSRRVVILAKLVVNAIPAGLALSLELAGLVFLLNPEIPRGLIGLGCVWLTFFAAYGVPALAVMPLLVAAFRFFATRPLRVRWIHPKSMVWFLAAATGIALVVYALNLELEGDLLGAGQTDILAVALVLILLQWIAAVFLAARAQIEGGEEADRRRAIPLILLVAGAPAASLALSLAGTGPQAASPVLPELAGRRVPVLFLGIEGADFSELLPLASEGRLPNFSRLLKEGAWGPVQTIRPCRSASAWASLSTGMRPGRHGIGDAARHKLVGLEDPLRRLPVGLLMRRWLPARVLKGREVTEEDLRARPLWEILDVLGVRSSFIGWPLAPGAPTAGTKAERDDRTARARRLVERLVGEGGGAADPTGEVDLLRAVVADLESMDAVLRLAKVSAPELLAAYLPGAGVAGARFMGYSDLEGPAGANEQARERYGHLLGRYFEQLDAWIGQARAAMPEPSYVLIVSAYGTEPPSWRSRLERTLAGLDTPSGLHDGGPAGILILDGPGVSSGRQVDDLQVTDAVPLVLYLMGLPLGRDMDGRLPRRLFHRAALEARPVTLIPTYGAPGFP